MNAHRWELPDEAATVAFGRQLASALRGGAVVYLQGELGAGKTTLSRGVVQGFGHDGPVKSPTYTLVEPYETPQGTLYHFDLYRLSGPEELEFMGVRDYFGAESLCLIEWPARGAGLLPPPDITVEIQAVENGRTVQVSAGTARGCAIFAQLLAMHQLKE